MNEPPQAPAPLPYWVAHTPSKQTPRFHELTKHILRVSEMARGFAVHFGGGEIAYFLGLLHDLGKFKLEFQQYLRDCYLAEKRKGTAPKKGSVPHKQAGALAAQRMMEQKWGRLLSLLLYGHHSRMLSHSETPRRLKQETSDAEVSELLERAVAVDAALRPLVPDVAPLEDFGDDLVGLEMYLRMLYSCLVDADGLDTESHTDPESTQRRAAVAPVALVELRDGLLRKQAEEFEGRAGVVNRVRRDVYEACIRAAEMPPGFFELTVPTGSGKTRSSLAFALCHAARHEMRRVIYAIPYTSIVDQTASVFRGLFGDDAGVILEHHSAIDPPKQRTEQEGETDFEAEEKERWRRLAAQNWDAPLIVTTTVQLFESLFSNRPSACRKLHRLVGSVIVLDEAQCLPPQLLIPIRSGLKALVERYGVTVVFCTATQPAHDVENPHLEGITPHSIISEPDRSKHFETLKRVRYRVVQGAWNWERVAEDMQRSEQSCLCVVNTRREALDLLQVLDPEGSREDVLHLSTLLCGRHRQDVIEEIKIRLKNGPRVLLVSTSVIECGVDLDFPRAMRAIGPLERIIQAAGRCNREGLRSREESEVVVFTPDDGASPKGFYHMAMQRTMRLLYKGQEEVDLDDPVFVTAYFRDLYEAFALDRKQIGGRIQEDRRAFRYDDVAEKMQLIEQDTVGVFVTDYQPEEAQAILQEMYKRGRMTRDLWQRAQPFCVALPHYEAFCPQAPVEEIVSGLLVWRGKYDLKTGIPLDRGIADLTYVPSALIAP